VQLKRFLCELANAREEASHYEWLHKKFPTFFAAWVTMNELILYRDELRLLWHPRDGVPVQDWREYEAWQKIRPDAEPGEMICNRWLKRSEIGLLAVWDKTRRELIPSQADLPAILVYGCLLFADRLSYCGNPQCSAPWYIGKRRGQQYCSDECSWPAKKAAKKKWWDANRAKKTSLLSSIRRTQR